VAVAARTHRGDQQGQETEHVSEDEKKKTEKDIQKCTTITCGKVDGGEGKEKRRSWRSEMADGPAVSDPPQRAVASPRGRLHGRQRPLGGGSATCPGRWVTGRA